MILFQEDWSRESAVIHENSNNQSFLRLSLVLRRMGIQNHYFPLTLIQKDLMGHDPHALTDPSEELRLRIAYECKINPWYFFREVVRIPASGGATIAFRANRANMAMIWCFYNNLSYIAIQPRQSGKAQPLNTQIKTPMGWTNMGHLKVGDLVTTPDGSSAPVIGVYPQGIKPIYRITFEDGRSTECCEEHLWKVHNRYWGPQDTRWRVIPLRDIKTRMIQYPNTEAPLSIPLIKPDTTPDQDLPLDPYLVGALIGGGGLTRESVHFTTTNELILNEIKRLVPKNVRVVHGDQINYRLVDQTRLASGKSTFHDTLRSMGILGTYSWSRSIPTIYVHASTSQRLALLQGLMDTKGSVDLGSSASFCTTSQQLSMQIQYIVRSLGGICKISTKTLRRAHHNEKREGRAAYTLHIRLNDLKNMFRFSHKTSRVTDTHKSADKFHLSIKSVEFVGHKEAQCIEIDHPDHLYITDDFIVTHNTVTACAICTHVMYIYGYNIEITLYTKDSALVQANVGRVKTMREALPRYLVFEQVGDTDNKEGLSYEALKNRYRTAIAQKDKQGADNLGRGMTSPLIHIDEPGFCTNIELTYPVMMLSTLAAVKNAARNEQPHCNILTTTAAPIDTARGRFTFELVNRAMPMTEHMYDLKDTAAAKALVYANSANNMVNGTYSYLMLGLTRSWYEEACRISDATQDINDRELLNIWKSGSETSILDPETIRVLNANKFEAKHITIVHDYVIKWYISEDALKSSSFSKRRFILGMDSSENIGVDFTTLVMIDVSDLSVICTFRCNETNTIKIGMFIAEFLILYPNITFIPERNSTGGAIIDTITLVFVKNALNPFRRIFNQVVQNRQLEEMARVNIDDPALADTQTKKHLGFRTSSKTRPYLYKNTLKKAAGMNATRIYDITLINELSSLAAINGRIDHAEGNHDDMVIAYLLACWLIFFGENLQYYGIDPREITSRITVDGTIIDPVHRDRQLALQVEIKRHQDIIETGSSEFLKYNAMQKLLMLQRHVDPSLTHEPIGLSKVSQDVQDYGRRVYTPQEFAQRSHQQHTNTQSMDRLLKLFS